MKVTKTLLIMSALSLASCQRHDAIIRDDFDGPHADGSYKWAVETEGGIFHEQRGSLQGEKGLLVEGQYQYTAPNGEVINVLYRADQNGFHAEGAHIPTAPPSPRAIQRALGHQATAPPSYDY